MPRRRLFDFVEDGAGQSQPARRFGETAADQKQRGEIPHAKDVCVARRGERVEHDSLGLAPVAPAARARLGLLAVGPRSRHRAATLRGDRDRSVRLA